MKKTLITFFRVCACEHHGKGVGTGLHNCLFLIKLVQGCGLHSTSCISAHTFPCFLFVVCLRAGINLANLAD